MCVCECVRLYVYVCVSISAVHSQQDSLGPLQQLALVRVEEDAVLLQHGAPRGGQPQRPGAPAVTAPSVEPIPGATGTR